MILSLLFLCRMKEDEEEGGVGERLGVQIKQRKVAEVLQSGFVAFLEVKIFFAQKMV